MVKSDEDYRRSLGALVLAVGFRITWGLDLTDEI